MEERWDWKSGGEIRDGKKYYSSIVKGNEVIKLRDTAFIHGHAKSKPYVAEIRSFHENLTDGQACADIYWYFRPDEMKAMVNKMAARSRPELPPLAKNEVVVTNRRDTIEVSTIAGLTTVKTLALTDDADKEGSEDEPVARFRFDVLRNTIAPISNFSASATEDRTQSEISSPSGGTDSDSSQGRVRHRSKGELRPKIASRKSFSPAISPRDGTNVKKTFQYKDIMSSPLPKLSSPTKSSSSSLRLKQPASPLLKSRTSSTMTTPSKSVSENFDSLLPGSTSRKRSSFASTPEYWVGKQSKVRKLEGNLRELQGHSSPGKGSSRKTTSANKERSSDLSPFKGIPPKDSIVLETSSNKMYESPVIKGKRSQFSSISQKSPEKAKIVLSKFSPNLASYSKRQINVPSPSNNKTRLTGKKVLDQVAEEMLDESGPSDSEDSEDSEDPFDANEEEEEEEFEEEKEKEDEWTPAKRTPKTPGYSRLLVGGTPKSSLKTTSSRRRVNRNTILECDGESVSLGSTPRKVHTLVIPEKIMASEERKKGRKRKIDEREELLELARERLHVSAVPDSLPCRDEEFSAICRFVEDNLHNNTGGCMYISGMPGVGKTALVREVARYLRMAVDEDVLPAFKFVEVNGMKVTAPPKIFISIVAQLTGQQASTDSALAYLKKHAVSDQRTLLLVDEVDYLYTKKQKVLYELFSLPGMLNSKLVMLVVTNTLDLHERVMKSSTTSRLGLTRVDFKPYTHQQLQQIIKSRLEGLKVFEPDAVELASRKLAAKCGDARRVLDVCRRAVEIASLEERGDITAGSKTKGKGKGKGSEVWLVAMRHLQQAMDELCNLPMVNAIRHSTIYQKKVLLAVVALVHATGQEETTMRDIYTQLKELLAVEGLDSVNFSQLIHLSSSLCSSNIIVVSNTVCDVARKVKLVPNLDDIVFALREE